MRYLQRKVCKESEYRNITLAETPESFTQMLFAIFVMTPSAEVEPSKMDTARNTILHEPGTCRPIPAFIGNVVLHTGFWVDFKFDGLNWPPEP